MRKPRVGIIGAGRNISGIGEYYAKFFKQCGAEVASILGTTVESADETARFLNERYSIKANPYPQLTPMLEKERLDIVAICSPSRTHHLYLTSCLNADISVLCEKPFVWGEDLNLLRETKAIINLAEDRNLTLGMNCQWAFTLGYYQELCGKIQPGKISEFYMYLSPQVTGINMLPESLPHPLSVLHSVLGEGTIDNITFREFSQSLSITFNYSGKYGGCAARIELKPGEKQPRRFLYGFNGKIMERVITLPDYTIHFKYNRVTIQADDPLKLSITDFLKAMANHTPPGCSGDQITSNMTRLLTISNAFDLLKTHAG